MKKLLNSGLLLIGAAALTLTLATAEDMMDNAGKCGNSTKGMMDNSGKCGNSTKGMKDMMDNSGKGGAAMEKKEAPKSAPAKGKCGQGKCGG